MKVVTDGNNIILRHINGCVDLGLVAFRSI